MVAMAGVRVHSVIDCAGNLTSDLGATIIDSMSTMVFFFLHSEFHTTTNQRTRFPLYYTETYGI
jgi:hypothetical protein